MSQMIKCDACGKIVAKTSAEFEKWMYIEAAGIQAAGHCDLCSDCYDRFRSELLGLVYDSARNKWVKPERRA